MVLRTTLVFLAMVACAPRATVAILPTLGMQEPVLTTPRIRVSTSEAYALRWGQTTVEGPGCFFFSGPPLPHNEVLNPLGAAVEVRHVEGRLYVSIEGATLSGEARSGPVRVELSRSFTSGEKWHVVESLELDSGEAPRSGTYRYRECSDSQGRGCRSVCTIDSEFTFVE